MCKYITTNMTKEELLLRLSDIEWDDFESGNEK